MKSELNPGRPIHHHFFVFISELSPDSLSGRWDKVGMVGKYVLVKLMDPQMGHKKPNQFSNVPLDLLTCPSNAVEEEIKHANAFKQNQWPAMRGLSLTNSLLNRKKPSLWWSIEISFPGDQNNRVDPTEDECGGALIRNVRQQLINLLYPYL